MQLERRLASEQLSTADEPHWPGPAALHEFRGGATHAAPTELLPLSVAALTSEPPLPGVAMHADRRVQMLTALLRGIP